MMKIALDECVDMLGKEFVEQHKHLCCCTYGLSHEGKFLYNLGMDTEEIDVPMGDETPMKFYAYVVVDPINGKVTRDYKNSILPS
ncbi:MAG: hypothetical protein MRZ59_07135 [Clostridiales bacterium]|nr:hypothetical protein [Clostridiales bacterium]MDY3747914.1 hypothetical protein [Lachnospiraceae bacterium]